MPCHVLGKLKLRDESTQRRRNRITGIQVAGGGDDGVAEPKAVCACWLICLVIRRARNMTK
jgi:hypothetical protein